MNPARFILSSVLLILAGHAATAQQEPPAPPPTQQALEEAISTANRMVITLPLEDTPAFEISDASVGKEFLQHCQIEEAAEWFHCMCYGDGWITLFADDRKLAQIGFHHALSIRWIDGPWSSDARLTGDGGVQLSQWFRDKGYSRFEDLRLQHLAWQAAENEKRERFAEQLPPDLLKSISSSGGPFSTSKKIARKALTDSTDRPGLLASVFRAFGQIPTSDTGYDNQMGVARDIVELASAEDLGRALESIANDPDGLRGAAYLYCAFPLHTHLDASLASTWSVRLAEVVFATFDGSRRSDAVSRLLRTPGRNVDELLVSIASGAREFHLQQPYVRDEYDDEPDLIAASCLALAMRHNASASDLAHLRSQEQRDEQGIAALKIAQSLTSSTLNFAKDVFAYKSFLIGFGALQALEEMPEDAIPASHMGAALNAPWGAVRNRAEALGAKLKLARAEDKPPSNDDEIQFDPELAQDEPATAIDEFTTVLPKAIGTTKARLLRSRSAVYAKLGRLEEALDDINAAREIAYQRDDPVETGRLLWQLGRVKEAVRQLSSIYPMSDPWALEVRGVALLSNEQYREAERDLSSAVLIDPRDPYRLFFQHFGAVLSGHPELSRLRSERAEMVCRPEEWPFAIYSYLVGEMSEADLLNVARSTTEDAVRNEAEALYYVSLSARTRSEPRERDLVAKCVAMNQVRLTEHWLAKARLKRLAGGENPSSP